MKKDALYWGIVAVFVSFFLMVLWMVYDVWKTGQERRRVQMMASQASETKITARNFAGLSFIKGQDGKEMVLVPEGPFPMGSQEAEGDPDEIPQRTLYLSAFYIDLHEVTWAEFRRFIEATGFPPPVVPVFQDDLSLITAMDLPVVGVSWEQARAYCNWAGERLPTEAEWEKAARGEQNLKWPWGNVSEERLANAVGEHDGYQYSAPPGRFEIGRSPYGLYDMAGNVAEWVSDWYDPGYYMSGPFRDPKGPERGKHRVYRGGSWNDSMPNLRTAKRFAAAPHQASAVIGFRCAKDVTTATKMAE
jgi:formylglycine-generating enzyme required for sulfatase activity